MSNRGPKKRPRFPFEPIQKLFDKHTVDRDIAYALGIERNLVVLARQRGLSEWQADKFACKLGIHPALIWGDLWWDTAELEDKP